VRRLPKPTWAYDGFNTLTFIVATSEEELKSLCPREGLYPDVDLDSNILIAVHRGLCKSGGYSVRINEITVDGGEVIVRVMLKDPSPEDAVTLVMTCPVDIVEVPKKEIGLRGEVKFKLVDQRGLQLGQRIVRLG